MEIGTRVGYAETFRGVRWVKIGNVCELPADETTAGRVRVKWAYWRYESGHTKEDTKRTWVQIKKLIVNPVEF